MEEKKEMKYLFSIMLVLVMVLPVFAQDVIVTPAVEPVPVITPVVPVVTPVEVKKFTVTSPMETNVVGFWFPSDGTFAVGLSQTFLRIEHTSIPKLSLDLDFTIAQEVNENKDTLAGIGVKLNYNSKKADSTGFVFIPSLGITALNDFAKNKAFKEIAQNIRIAIYGSILLYKW
jgi:hypothetical protein